jgi:hypothetical protein
MRLFVLATASRPALDLTQLPNQRVPVALTPAIKRLGLGTDHSPPSSAEVKNEWSYNFNPHYVLRA